MVRLLRAFNSCRQATAPSPCLLQRRCYAAAPNPFTAAAREGRKPTNPTFDNRRVLESVAVKGTPLRGLDGPLPEGVTADGKGIKIQWEKGRLSLLYVMLRDACRCPLCVDPYSKQRNFRTSDINLHVRPRAINLDGDTLEIKWVNDLLAFGSTHVSTYSLKDLAEISPLPVRSSAGMKRRRLFWNRAQMTQVQHWITYEDYMSGGAKFAEAMRHLALTGLVFVKDIPESREEVKKIAAQMGPLRNTFYGATWDVRSVPQAKNVAYTNQDLDFHMDLMYMKNPPGYQLLHCLENSSVGGESLFLDSFALANTLHKMHPTVFSLLTSLHLNYEYDHDDHIYANRWPVLELGANNTPGDMDLLHVNYSPPFQGRLTRFKDYKTVSKSMRALNFFSRHLKDENRIFERKMQPGECVIFENRRVLHARRPFDLETGSRWLAGAYVDEEDLSSLFRYLSKEKPDDWYNYYLAEGEKPRPLAMNPESFTAEQEFESPSFEEQDLAAPEVEEIEVPRDEVTSSEPASPEKQDAAPEVEETEKPRDESASR